MMSETVDPRVAPWSVTEQEWPASGSFQEQMRFLLRYAVLAPSTYNTQPWVFEITPEGIAVYADPSRQLYRLDPLGRELQISIGAAILNLRVAAARFGFACAVQYLPDGDGSMLMARLAFSPGPLDDPDLAALFPAIVRRRTNRQCYTRQPIPEPVMARLVASVAPTGIGIRILREPSLKARVAALVAEADHRQAQDPNLRDEVSRWLRSSWSLAEDGVAADGFGVPVWLVGFGARIVRALGLGTPRVFTDAQLTRSASAVVVFHSAETPAQWLRCGEALQRFLLAATREGFYCAFIPQPAEVGRVRETLRELLQLPDWPQLIIRVGVAPRPPLPMPRRSVEHVLR